MCAKGKCMYCLKVETGSLIFAVINMISSSLCLVACVILVIYFNIAMNTAENHYYQTQDAYFEQAFDMTRTSHTLTHQGFQLLGMGINLLLGISLTMTSIAFAFAIILIHGIVKKHIGLIKAYIIYGILKEIMMSITTIVLFNLDTGAGFGMLLASVIYLLILIMIGQTYTKFRSEVILQNVYQHQPLV